MIPICSAADAAATYPSGIAAQYAHANLIAPIGDRPLYVMLDDSTGGYATLEFYLSRHGYRPFDIEPADSARSTDVKEPYARQMREIKVGFGRTMTRLPVVFGVSRQTLYNWLGGETPKEAHRPKLYELAAAARVFGAAGFRPSGDMLDRTVTKGKSFLVALADGADGAETARKLMRIIARGSKAQARLDAALDGQPTHDSGSLDIAVNAYGPET